MALERPEIVVAPEYISSDVSHNHLAYESGSLRRSSQGSISVDAQTVASENERISGLENVERTDEKEIVDTIDEEDKLHEAVKSTASLGSKDSQNLPDKDVETNEANKLVNENDSITRTVKKRNKRLKKRTEKRTALNGRKVVYATECTQTDWNWKDKAEKSGTGTVLSSSVALSPSGEKVASAGSRSASVKSAQEKVASAGSRSASVKSAQAKSDSIRSMGQTQEEMESKGEVITATDLTPFFLVPDDEFGIPIVEMSSDSDISNEESFERSKHYRHYLPSIGPPQILRYIRESEILEKIGEKAHEDWDYVQMETPTFEEHDSSLGMFSGPCEFCGVDIKPFPSLDEQLSEPPESLYCCEEYREFVEFATTTAVRMEDEVMKDQQQISIKVHPHHGSAHDRHLAKEKAVQRMHERELLRRQQEANGLQAVLHQTGEPSIKSGRSSDFQSDDLNVINEPVARQMKTINYQLSSQRCLEEGWTLRAPSPMVTDDAESEMFVLEPLHPAMIATGKLQGRPLIEKFYQNGSKFLTIFPDGTGNVLYPSGRVAILISSIALGQNTFVVQDDSDEPVLLGAFQPNGYGFCCFANSKVRLTYDPLEGLELDYTGARKRVWSWKDQEVHIHAPPFQPIVFGMNSYIGIRFMAQENIALTFTGRKRSCRFNVGAKLKMVSPDNFQPKVIQEDELLIREHKIRVETILDKVSNLLKFPKSPKVDRILPPLSVSGRRQRMEKLKQASLSSHQTQKPFKQTKLPPLGSAAVSVN